MKHNITPPVNQEIFSFKKHHQNLRRIVIETRRKSSSRLNMFQWIFIGLAFFLSLTFFIPYKSYVAQMTTTPITAQEPTIPVETQQVPPETPSSQVVTAIPALPQDEIQKVNTAISQADATLKQQYEACRQQKVAYQQLQQQLQGEIKKTESQLRAQGIDRGEVDNLNHQIDSHILHIEKLHHAINYLGEDCNYHQVILQNHIKSLRSYLEGNY